MEPIESEGRTVAEAVSSALLKSGLRRDQVEVLVVQEGSSGILGLGATPARVRLSEKRWGPASSANSGATRLPNELSAERRPQERVAEQRPRERTEERHTRERVAEQRPRERVSEQRPKGSDEAPRPRSARPVEPRPLSAAEAAEACSKAQALVLELLSLMSIAAPTASASWDPALERVTVSVESQDASLLVAHDGRVLESLQFIVTLMLSRSNATPIAVQVETLSYWERREQAVLDSARRAIETVKATGKPVRMEPMDSSMRRLIHRTFSASPDITTASEGEGPWRKLVIRPK